MTHEHHSVSKRICGKYGEVEGGWCIKEVTKAFGLGVERHEEGLQELINRPAFCSKKNGRTKLWLDY